MQASLVSQALPIEPASELTFINLILSLSDLSSPISRSSKPSSSAIEFVEGTRRLKLVEEEESEAERFGMIVFIISVFSLSPVPITPSHSSAAIPANKPRLTLTLP